MECFVKWFRGNLFVLACQKTVLLTGKKARMIGHSCFKGTPTKRSSLTQVKQKTWYVPFNLMQSLQWTWKGDFQRHTMIFIPKVSVYLSYVGDTNSNWRGCHLLTVSILCCPTIVYARHLGIILSVGNKTNFLWVN